MSLSRTTEAYIGFLKISDRAYAEKIRYYEDNTNVLKILPEEEKLELQVIYVLALFEVGAYDKFLKKVDGLIAFVFEENIMTFRGNDVTELLLFKKACALHHTQQKEKAEKLAIQVYRMYPHIPQHKMLLRSIYYEFNSDNFLSIRATCIALYFLSAILIAVQLFLVDPFYPEFSESLKLTWQVVFALSTLILIGSEVYLRVMSNKQTEKLL